MKVSNELSLPLHR